MRVEKEQLSAYVGQLVKDSDCLFFISYKGLKVAELKELRGQLSKVQANCQVLKNTYIRRGLVQNQVALPADYQLQGDTAVVYGSSDAAAVAKVIRDFSKTHDKVKMKGGVLEGSLLAPASALAVADLPPREVLLAQLLGLLQAPMRQLLGVLNAKTASVVYVLQAYADQKAKQA